MRSIDGEVESSSGSRSGCPSYNLSVTFGDSSPSRGASGGAEKFPMEDEALRNAKASPTRRGGIASAMTERLYEGKPFLCRKVRLVASFPVSFWRKECYNGFAVHPAYLTGEEVDALAYFLTFLVSVGADVVSHFICKWLDRYEENRKA